MFIYYFIVTIASLYGLFNLLSYYWKNMNRKATKLLISIFLVSLGILSFIILEILLFLSHYMIFFN